MQTCTKKKISTWKTLAISSVVEEGYMRKLLILGKAWPRQTVFFFFPVIVFYFLCLTTFLWESRLSDHSALKRIPSLPKFRENSDFTFSGLLMVLFHCLFESAPLRNLHNPRCQCFFFPGVYKNIWPRKHLASLVLFMAFFFFCIFSFSKNHLPLPKPHDLPWCLMLQASSAQSFTPEQWEHIQSGCILDWKAHSEPDKISTWPFHSHIPFSVIYWMPVVC